MVVKRFCIYPKDVQKITGKSERSARRILKQLREDLGKADHELITVKDFAKYAGIDESTVSQYITD